MIRKLSFLAAISLATACGGSQSAPTSQPTEEAAEPAVEETAEEEVEDVVQAAEANVRLVHASAASPVRVRTNGESINEDALIGGTWTTSRVAVASGEHTFSAGPSGGGEEFASATATLAENGNYTLVFIGDDTQPGAGSGPAVVVLEDDLSAPEGDTASVRFVHGVPGTGSVSLSDGAGRGYAAGLGFGDASGYYDIAPTDNTFAVAAGGEEVASFDVPLTAGLVFTVILVGEADGVGSVVVSEGLE